MSKRIFATTILLGCCSTGLMWVIPSQSGQSEGPFDFKTSALFRQLAKSDAEKSTEQFCREDPRISSWSVGETRRYVLDRTRDLTGRIRRTIKEIEQGEPIPPRGPTEKFEDFQRRGTKRIVAALRQTDELWEGAAPFPTVLDYLAFRVLRGEPECAKELRLLLEALSLAEMKVSRSWPGVDERTREANSVLASAAEAALGKYRISGKLEDLDGAGRGTAEEDSPDSQSRGERAPGRKHSVSPANKVPWIWQNAMPLLGACLVLLVLIIGFVLLVWRKRESSSQE